MTPAEHIISVAPITHSEDPMSAFNPRESVGFQCSLTFRAFTAALERRLRGSGVSRAQFMALAHLVGLGPMPQAELAAHLGITPASAVRLIDRMERDGWVERRPDPADRRVNRVAPTEKALAVWDQLSEHARGLLQDAYRGIPDGEIRRTIETLERIRANLRGP
ncbi:MarR family winged helix-turn-helix transcriptional regulator [Deferrisoma sp.]